MSATTDAKHPARYSPEVLDTFRQIIPRLSRVHDPFAGTGERLGHVADDRSWFFTGSELVPEFIVDHRVSEGDATDPESYPWPIACGSCGETTDVAAGCSRHVLRPYTIVTSPVYPNGMADHFISTAADASSRMTYRHAAAALSGNPRYELSETNMGRWGYRSTDRLDARARMMYWHLARRSVRHWSDAERALVNVSDFLAGDRRVPVVDQWVELLQAHGWSVDLVHEVRTRRNRNGANGDRRVETEQIIDASRY